MTSYVIYEMHTHFTFIIYLFSLNFDQINMLQRAVLCALPTFVCHPPKHTEYPNFEEGARSPAEFH